MNLTRISVVTSSLNQAEFLEQTIQSILNQEYPNLEYIIMDGGSTDGSVEIIKKYANRLTYWESKPDKGQADAIMKGFNISTGEILCWINSDDILLPNAIQKVVDFFDRHNDTELLIGGCVLIDEKNKVLVGKRKYPRFNLGMKATQEKIILLGTLFNQPASFWKRDVFFKVGGLDKSLFFSFDLDLYLKLTQRKNAKQIKTIIAGFRIHNNSKTHNYQDVRLEETNKILNTYNVKWKKIKLFYYSLTNIVNQRLIQIMYYLKMIKIPGDEIT